MVFHWIYRMSQKPTSLLLLWFSRYLQLPSTQIKIFLLNAIIVVSSNQVIKLPWIIFTLYRLLIIILEHPYLSISLLTLILHLYLLILLLLLLLLLFFLIPSSSRINRHLNLLLFGFLIFSESLNHFPKRVPCLLLLQLRLLLQAAHAKTRVHVETAQGSEEIENFSDNEAPDDLIAKGWLLVLGIGVDWASYWIEKGEKEFDQVENSKELTEED